MTIKTNVWSFAVALLWTIFAGIAGFGHITPVLGVDPWYVVLFGSLITFVFGLYGLAGVTDFTSHVRGMLTAVITAGLATSSAAVIVMAHLFQFT